MNSDRHVVRAVIFGSSLTLVSPKEPQLSASLQLSGMAMKGFGGKPVTGSSPPGSRPKSWPVELFPIWDSIGAEVYNIMQHTPSGDKQRHSGEMFE